ncbi:flavodoxin FldA [Zymomonas mobilis]|uniref:Flavodoxin n=1 Tax=Zymomonas mobilis subsp. pomaceae (strain ATCC 29192 / DSM 22645 / JCM 10191 / CCUG 17912 / NBRC 13757 / NCIMB 11200 / NRRL B-4491 / Barker I) TaxID=579138 RepID=F8EUD9_ZYMMT|nr:flavodoxin FldA [Zymomonas mobilis]AEI38160.1 flavodoxin [Zymomonas mobilis subsp. pomaceae ATCC 29192]MDX5947850.1 flavodoxin FldA [Zymomonas mobilis subsp. pomaceae]GEB90079.1 flavodoxin [Zymomonas mobilis subsp. pomaceae]
MSVTIVFGSDSGCTKKIASRIASQIDARTVNITKAQSSDFEDCSLLILGCPTYGDGDLQADWEDHLNALEEAELKDKKVALFGTGDQEIYPDSFVDAIGILYDIVVGKGAKVIGFTKTEGYSFTHSAALRDGQFVGLALDEDNQSSETDDRIAAWLPQLS